MFGINLVEAAKGELAHVDLNHNGIPDIIEAENELVVLEKDTTEVCTAVAPIISTISVSRVAADLAKLECLTHLEPAQISALATGIITVLNFITKTPMLIQKIQNGIKLITGGK